VRLLRTDRPPAFLPRPLAAFGLFLKPSFCSINPCSRLCSSSPHLIISLNPPAKPRLREPPVSRDSKVWQFAIQQRAPILMLLSGGYTKASAGVIVDSLEGLLRRWCGLGG